VPTLFGCVTDSKGTPPFAVDLSALQVCERVLAPVKRPAVTATTDARVAFVKDDAALSIARGEIKNGRRCVADVRQRYAAQKKR